MESWSEVRFLMRTQNFFFVPHSDKTKTSFSKINFFPIFFSLTISNMGFFTNFTTSLTPNLEKLEAGVSYQTATTELACILNPLVTYTCYFFRYSTSFSSFWLFFISTPMFYFSTTNTRKWIWSLKIHQQGKILAASYLTFSSAEAVCTQANGSGWSQLQKRSLLLVAISTTWSVGWKASEAITALSGGVYTSLSPVLTEIH